jgi:hypothetical protein
MFSLFYRAFWKKRKHFGSLGLMDKNLERLGRRSEEIESVRAIERRKYAIERTNVRAPKKRSNAPAFVRKRGDRSQCDRSQPECE